MLKEQNAAAQEKLSELSSDIMFLRDQITTTEVNVSRCWNFDVTQRAAKKEEEAANAEIQKEN